MKGQRCIEKRYCIIWNWRVSCSALWCFVLAGLVYLRRDVSIEDEDGFSYSIKICVNDTKHNLQPEVCGILNVTFISKYFAVHLWDYFEKRNVVHIVCKNDLQQLFMTQDFSLAFSFKLITVVYGLLGSDG